MAGGSGSQRTTALATPARHNRTAGTGAHPQTEAVNPRPAPVVRLKGALALGHDCLSSSRLAVTRLGTITDALPLLKLFEPARSRTPVAAVSPVVGRPPEGTEVPFAGQTALLVINSACG